MYAAISAHFACSLLQDAHGPPELRRWSDIDQLLSANKDGRGEHERNDHRRSPCTSSVPCQEVSEQQFATGAGAPTQFLFAAAKQAPGRLTPNRFAGDRQSTQPQTQDPLQYDLGLLAVFDTSPLEDVQAYTSNREDFLTSNAREAVQGLINQLWERPTTISDDGIMASLPEISTTLPREKPLPKLKELTKWEKFAKSKGILQKPKKDRMVFDEEKQEYVARYGYKGKNKEKEDSWLVEVPGNADAEFNPRTAAKKERKERVEKNLSKEQRNVSRAQAASSKKRRNPSSSSSSSKRRS